MEVGWLISSYDRTDMNKHSVESRIFSGDFPHTDVGYGLINQTDHPDYYVTQTIYGCVGWMVIMQNFNVY